MEIFGARGGPGMLALLSKGGDAIRDMTASITGPNKANEMVALLGPSAKQTVANLEAFEELPCKKDTNLTVSDIDIKPDTYF